METPEATPNRTAFTCISCAIAFATADEQRRHYQSDHHRYNMKRRVASLMPVSVVVFNQKVLERKAETSITISAEHTTCKVCNKSYTTENAYKSHINSKKHRETELKQVHKPKPVDKVDSAEQSSTTEPKKNPKTKLSQESDESLNDQDLERSIDEKIAAARARLSPNQCLFCPAVSPTLEDNLAHMSTSHSFFIPDVEFLTDMHGLVNYLGEKIAVGNFCIYCNERGREFRTLDAVRKHMVDKGHCKIAFDTDKDRLEISDYYDYTSSYDDNRWRPKSRKTAKDEGWEDVEGDDDDDADEVVEEDASDSDSLPGNQLTYGDSAFELVLPSGARIGHRSLRRYYAQSFRYTASKEEDPKSGASIVRRLLADKSNALVPTKGGFGAFGQGMQVVKARNVGEAREAGRHVREFRDQKRRERFKTKVAFRNNNQKHFRDPLLQ